MMNKAVSSKSVESVWRWRETQEDYYVVTFLLSPYRRQKEKINLKGSGDISLILRFCPYFETMILL